MEQASKRGPELHPPGYNFLGPRTEFYARMIGSDFYKNMMINAGRKPVGKEPYNKPVNEIDRCAYEHDSVFARNNNTEKNIRDADKKFRECADKIKDPKLSYYAEIQFYKSIIKTKEIFEDIGIISPGLFANINRSIDDLNMTLAKNHTIPSTKEEQQQVDRNFWIASLLIGFKLIGKLAVDLIVIPTGTRLTTQKLIKLVKRINIDLMTRIPVGLRPMFEFLVNRLMARQDISEINKKLVDLSFATVQNFIESLLQYSNLFGTGVTGMIVKYGVQPVAQAIIDNFLTRLSTQFGSDSWRERNIMTGEELKKIIEGEDPEIFKADAERNTFMTNMLGFGLRNARIVEIINLFRNIENLTNRQKIERFGNFYRAIIQIRNRKPDSVLNVIYLLLTGSHAREFVGDITLEKLRVILNLKLTNVDIDTLLSRRDLLEKYDKLTKSGTVDELFLRQFTYMELIDYILITLPSKGLLELLS